MSDWILRDTAQRWLERAEAAETALASERAARAADRERWCAECSAANDSKTQAKMRLAAESAREALREVVACCELSLWHLCSGAPLRAGRCPDEGCRYHNALARARALLAAPAPAKEG